MRRSLLCVKDVIYHCSIVQPLQRFDNTNRLFFQMDIAHFRAHSSLI